MSRTSAIAMATVLTDADVAVAPRVRRSRAVVSGQDRCATITARSAITLSVLERVETCPCLSPERARVSLNRMEIDDMPTRLAPDMDCRRIVLPLRLSTRRAIVQGALAIALMAAAPPGTRAQQKAEKLLAQDDDKPQGEQQCDRCCAVPAAPPPSGVPRRRCAFARRRR
jgi:hypothetical protein